MPDLPESGEASPAAGRRRNFTEVASLFQPIVPPPGAAPPPAAAFLVPPPLQSGEPPPPAPPVAAPASPPPRPASSPPPPQRPASPVEPKEAWADAWAPQPNWRPRRSWSWVLLLPFGVLAAWVVLSADPVTIRMFINQHIWRRDASNLPPPAPRPAPAPAPAPAPIAGPAPAQPKTTPEPTVPFGPLAASGTPQPETPSAGLPLGPLVLAPQSPADAIAPAASSEPVAPPGPSPSAASPLASGSTEPTSPPPAEPPAPTTAPPGTAAAPPARPPAAPTQGFGQVTIRYRRSGPNAEAEAARAAARLQPKAERVETRAVSTGYGAPTVLYFRPDDRAAAVALAQALQTGTTPWTIRLGQTRQRPGYLEVWLP